MVADAPPKPAAITGAGSVATAVDSARRGGEAGQAHGVTSTGRGRDVDELAHRGAVAGALRANQVGADRHGGEHEPSRLIGHAEQRVGPERRHRDAGNGAPRSSVTTPSIRPATRSTPGTADEAPLWARACTSGCAIAVEARLKPSASAVSVTDRVMGTPVTVRQERSADNSRKASRHARRG